MIQIGQLQKGMYLSNDGNGNIPVYDKMDSTEPMLTITPGQMIGLITDFKNNTQGAAVIFYSDEIASSVPFGEKVLYYSNPLLWGTGYKITGIVNFRDLQANVSDAQVEKQNAAIANANANGTSIANDFKEVVTGVSDAITSNIPWGLAAGAVGVYVLLNWKNFFKPVNIKK